MFHLSDNLRTIFKKRKRVGRGEGSNRGKNCGKGHKGQTKHGGKVPVTFEGGGKTLVRRTPKYAGFKARDRKDLAVVVLSAIESNYKDNEKVSLETLREKGLIGSKIKKVRVIKKGELTKKVEFEESENLHLTKGVKEAIKS